MPNSLFLNQYLLPQTENIHFVRGSITLGTADLLFYSFGFNKTSKSEDNFNITKNLSLNQKRKWSPTQSASEDFVASF